MKLTKLNKIFTVLTAAATLTLLGACGANASKSTDGLAKIKAAGVLKVGTEAQYAPYEFKDANAKFVGADIALAEQIAKDLGVKLEIVDMKFEGIIPSVQSGKVDLGIAAFSNTPERAGFVDFSTNYEASVQKLVVPADKATEYETPKSLAGLKVGAQKGSIQSGLVKEELKDSILFELDKYPTLALEIQNGNIAGLVADEAVANSLVATSNGKLALADYKFTSEAANVGKAALMAREILL
ncbi:transporter substrate-binding domain-containing protein [Arcanobacterium hippocoleae]|uniref:transporter substrate-binding domain-containing protein n=1 Tax=Arcanobacterium hippocoleae TaxID=149017 RepID=UPI003340EC3F